MPSRLKGIETLGVFDLLILFYACAYMLSRLKGIETRLAT